MPDGILVAFHVNADHGFAFANSTAPRLGRVSVPRSNAIMPSTTKVSPA
jgi:hypothetical protein